MKPARTNIYPVEGSNFSNWYSFRFSLIVNTITTSKLMPKTLYSSWKCQRDNTFANKAIMGSVHIYTRSMKRRSES